MHIEHGIDDVDKSLVSGEESMSPREKVAFMPTLQGVLGEHFEYSAIGGQLAAVGVLRQIVSQPQFLAHLVNCVELVRGVFIGPEDAKGLRVQVHYIAQESAEGPGVLRRSL